MTVTPPPVASDGSPPIELQADVLRLRQQLANREVVIRQLNLQIQQIQSSKPVIHAEVDNDTVAEYQVRLFESERVLRDRTEQLERVRQDLRSSAGEIDRLTTELQALREKLRPLTWVKARLGPQRRLPFTRAPNT